MSDGLLALCIFHAIAWPVAIIMTIGPSPFYIGDTPQAQARWRLVAYFFGWAAPLIGTGLALFLVLRHVKKDVQLALPVKTSSSPPPSSKDSGSLTLLP